MFNRFQCERGKNYPSLNKMFENYKGLKEDTCQTHEKPAVSLRAIKTIVLKDL